MRTMVPNALIFYEGLRRAHQNSKPSRPNRLTLKEASAPSHSDVEPAVDAVFAAAAVSFAAVCVVVDASFIAACAVSVAFCAVSVAACAAFASLFPVSLCTFSIVVFDSLVALMPK